MTTLLSALTAVANNPVVKRLGKKAAKQFVDKAADTKALQYRKLHKLISDLARSQYFHPCFTRAIGRVLPATAF